MKRLSYLFAVAIAITTFSGCGMTSNAPASSASSSTTTTVTPTTVKPVGQGRYLGDIQLYYGNYSGMSLSFANYSGLTVLDPRVGTSNNLSGYFSTTPDPANSFGWSTFGWPTLSIAGNVGAAISNQNRYPVDVELLLAPLAPPPSIRAFSTASNSVLGGFESYMLLNFLGLDAVNQNILGDIRVYRNDVGFLFTAKCTQMDPSPGSMTGIDEAYLTLYSKDHQNYKGHIRLVNKVPMKILSYDVTGTRDINGIRLALSRPIGTLVKRSNASSYLTPLIPAPTTGSGFITLDMNGYYNTAATDWITQWSINLSSGTNTIIYDARSAASIKVRRPPFDQ